MDSENYSEKDECLSSIIHFSEDEEGKSPGTPPEVSPLPDDGENEREDEEDKSPGTPPEVSPLPDDGETTEDEVKTPDTPPEVSPLIPDDGETTEDEVKTPKVVSPKLSPGYARPSPSLQKNFEEFVKTKWNTYGAKMYGEDTLPAIFIVKYLLFLLLMYKEGTEEEEEVYLTSANVGNMSQDIFLQGSDDTKKDDIKKKVIKKKVKSAFQDMMKRLSNSISKFFVKQRLVLFRVYFSF